MFNGRRNRDSKFLRNINKWLITTIRIFKISIQKKNQNSLLLGQVVTNDKNQETNKWDIYWYIYIFKDLKDSCNIEMIFWEIIFTNFKKKKSNKQTTKQPIMAITRSQDNKKYIQIN